MINHLVYFSLGSNLGNRLSYISQARSCLQRIGLKEEVHSSIYETSPWGNTEQPAFLNQVSLYSTRISPHDLLLQIHKIELELGRERRIKYDPRTIDIDILFYDHISINTSELTIPHPKIIERKFILEPMCEIAPEFIHPVYNEPMHVLLSRCKDNGTIRKLSSNEIFS